MIVATEFLVVKRSYLLMEENNIVAELEYQLRYKCFLFILFLLPGCRQWRRKENQKLQKLKLKNTKLYVIYVKDVECKQCVLAALYALKSAKQIKHVECLCPKGKYDQSRFECFIKTSKKEEFPITLIKKKLAIEDFELEAIEGVFSGLLFAGEDKLQFEYQETSFNVIGDDMVIIRLKEKFESNKPLQIKLSGTINFLNKQFYVN